MRRITLHYQAITILLFCLSTFSFVVAQEPDSSSALYQMREAERNFAMASVMHGRNAAFTGNFAEESIIFTDTWLTNGRQFWKDRKVLPVVLKWEPEFMDIAASRDFGISTGPWEAQEYRPYTALLATGYFLTVWKKQPGGVWQVILDAGTTTPVRADYDHTFSFPSGADKTVTNPGNIDAESARSELVVREKQMLAAWKNNPLPATYNAFLAPAARLQRNGHFPTTNADTVRVWLARLQKTMRWKSVGSGAASSGDLGFTYGFLEIQDDQKASKEHYVRIWRKQPEGIWTIILEMMSMD